MIKRSAGILLFRFSNNELGVFLVHPGGPFWAKKDPGAWSIRKGEYFQGEDPLTAAQREFAEEIGVAVEGEFIPLGEVIQVGGKVVRTWAVQGDLDAKLIQSNTFTIEWPPNSGSMQEFPEADVAGWFSIRTAQEKLITAQVEFLKRLREHAGQEATKTK